MKKISREREFIADQFGAKAASGESLITALLKLGIYSNAWVYVTEKMINRIRNGYGYSRNISWLFSSIVEHNINSGTIAKNVLAVKDNSTTHPNDSHPPTSERASHLDVDITGISDSAFLSPDSSCIDLIGNYLEIEEDLTHFQQLYFDALGIKAGESNNANYMQKIISMYAAFITVADGKIEKSEIEKAETIGISLFDNFDYFDFREYCHYPDSLPEFEKLLEACSDFDAPLKDLIYKMCEDIANADGAVSTEEAEYMERIKSSFSVSAT